MGFRPVSQRLRNVNLRALGKFSCLALVLDLESMDRPAGPVQTPSFGQGTASPSFVTPLDLEGPARTGVEMWNAGLSGAVSVRDKSRWVFWTRRV